MTQRILKTFLKEVFGNIYLRNPDTFLDVGDPYEQYKHSHDAIIKLKYQLHALDLLRETILTRIEVNKLFDELWENINEPVHTIHNISQYWNKKFRDLNNLLSYFSKTVKNLDELIIDVNNIIHSCKVGKNRVDMFRKITKMKDGFESSLAYELTLFIKNREFDKAFKLINQIKNKT